MPEAVVRYVIGYLVVQSLIRRESATTSTASFSKQAPLSRITAVLLITDFRLAVHSSWVGYDKCTMHERARHVTDIIHFLVR